MRDKKYIASWSGGKDSTYMVNELLKKGEKLDAIIFADTGFEFEIMYEYIEKIKKYWENKYKGVNIVLLNWKKGKKIWDSRAEGEFTKGQHVGKKRGFPFSLGMSWCTRDLKVNPMQKYIKENFKDCDVIEYIGIAYNEPKRITEDLNKKYPLFEWKITEDEIAQKLLDDGLHNPIYNVMHRTGCSICPKQSLTSLYKLWKHYPEEFDKIVKMQKKYKDGGYAIWKFKDFTTDELIEKFKKYEEKGKPSHYLIGDNEMGCMCK